MSLWPTGNRVEVNHGKFRDFTGLSLSRRDTKYHSWIKYNCSRVLHLHPPTGLVFLVGTVIFQPRDSGSYCRVSSLSPRSLTQVRVPVTKLPSTTTSIRGYFWDLCLRVYSKGPIMGQRCPPVLVKYRLWKGLWRDIQWRIPTRIKHKKKKTILFDIHDLKELKTLSRIDLIVWTHTTFGGVNMNQSLFSLYPRGLQTSTIGFTPVRTLLDNWN